MLFVALYATCPAALWGAGAQPAGSPLFDLAAPSRMHWVAQWGLWAWMLHFLKREFETAFVHKFSRPTMPLSNLYVGVLCVSLSLSTSLCLSRSSAC